MDSSNSSASSHPGFIMIKEEIDNTHEIPLDARTESDSPDNLKISSKKEIKRESDDGQDSLDIPDSNDPRPVQPAAMTQFGQRSSRNASKFLELLADREAHEQRAKLCRVNGIRRLASINENEALEILSSFNEARFKGLVESIRSPTSELDVDMDEQIRLLDLISRANKTLAEQCRAWSKGQQKLERMIGRLLPGQFSYFISTKGTSQDWSAYWSNVCERVPRGPARKASIGKYKTIFDQLQRSYSKIMAQHELASDPIGGTSTTMNNIKMESAASVGTGTEGAEIDYHDQGHGTLIKERTETKRSSIGESSATSKRIKTEGITMDHDQG